VLAGGCRPAPLQHAVVVGGVAAEVLLDGAELGREQSGAGEYERLHDAGYASVAVGERVDGHEVQMGHGGTHGDVGVEVFVVQPVDGLAHERRNIVGVGAGVGRGSAGWACDVDRAGAPEPG